MVNDAEAYRQADEQQRDRINAKNQLESYCFQLRSTLDDEQLSSRFSPADRETIQQRSSETIAWLDANQLAERQEFEHKQQELERICSPIITRLYQGSGMAPPPPPTGGSNSGATGGSGPTIEEVD